MSSDTLTVIDNRTGKQYEIPIMYGTYPDYGAAIPAKALREIKNGDDDFGLLSYDPGFANTAAVRSSISFIDGEKGILRYRGYPIEDLAGRASFLEAAYLLIHGDLPKADELADWREDILSGAFVHEAIKKFMDGFVHTAHAMGVFVGTFGALSTFFPDATDVLDRDQRFRWAKRIIAMAPTIGAFSYRHRRGLPYIYPDENMSFAQNFLHMVFCSDGPYRDRWKDDRIVKALETLFVLHMDHEQNCSTTTMRTVGSSHASPFIAISAAGGALHGPLHGGANEAALAMLERIGTVDRIPDFLKKVRAKEERLMGFGHPVYRNYDPRAAIIKKLAHEVLEVTEPDPLLDVAKELEGIALSDKYFIERHLYPNVDFYSGIIYKAIGFPVEMITVLFAIPRVTGWLAHWLESYDDEDKRIVRPRQQYSGHDVRSWVDLDKR